MLEFVTMLKDLADKGAGNAACAFTILIGLGAMGLWVSNKFVSATQASEYATRADAAEMRQQISEIRSDVGEIKSRNFESDLIKAQERFCDAWKAGHATAQRYAIDKRRELTNEYHAEHNRAYEPPTCEELGYMTVGPR